MSQSDYYDINGTKLCDKNGDSIENNMDYLEQGETYPLLSHDHRCEEIQEFSYSAFICAVILHVFDSLCDFIYYVKNRDA